MGCGRSKHRSKNKDDDDSSSESKSHKRKQSKANKSSNPESGKENKNATKKDIPKRKLTAPVTQHGDVTGGSPQKQSNYTLKAPISPSNGSLSQNSTNILKQKEELKSTRLTLKDKQASANSNNSSSKVTNSQLDFFRMLDEKIEQGTDYASADDK